VSRRPLRQRFKATWFGAVGALLVLALGAAAYVQWRQLALLNLTVVYQDDYVVLSLYQLEMEYLRFREQCRAAVLAPAALDAETLQLRYDIFVSRVSLLENDRAARLLRSRDEFGDALRRLRVFVDRADLYFGESARAPLNPQALKALLGELDALADTVHGLTLNAAHHVADQVAQRNLTVQRHNQVALALTGFLIALTLAFALIALRQMRQLEERRRGLEQLAERLHEARGEAEAASHAKSAFLANMSHELRTPFQGLLGMLALLRDTPLNARQLDHLGTAQDSAQHLLAIVNDILDMSTLESGRLVLMPVPVELRRLVAEVESLMRGPAVAKGLALHVSVADAVPPWAELDPTRLRQVLFNLLSNAIKFSDAGGVSLAVHLRTAEDGTQRLRFAVSDTGIGIDPATQMRLFQRFAQGDATRSRRHGGTGLGLEISRSLARLMGGDITLHSEPGRGSSFDLELPLRAASAPPPGVSPASSMRATQAAEGGLRVLVAEDHPINQRVIAALLERLGHAARFTANGRDAVQATAEERFDLVLMDLHMPLMDGVAATQAIRARGASGAEPKIVALSADAFAETRERCLRSGMDDFLSKPVDLRELAALFTRLFPERGSTTAVLPAADAPAAAACQLLDGAVIDGVRAVMPAQRYGALLASFFDGGAAQLQAMREAACADRLDALRTSAHGMKGVALNLGLKALAATAQTLHKTPAEAGVQERLRLVDELEALLAASRGECIGAGLMA
jgi:signal transduction histidine kinase/CheY-like chemotaxis protein